MSRSRVLFRVATAPDGKRIHEALYEGRVRHLVSKCDCGEIVPDERKHGVREIVETDTGWALDGMMAGADVIYRIPRWQVCSAPLFS